MRAEAEEIIDGLLKIGESAQKASRIRALNNQNSRIASTCGSCYKWMTKQCYRELRHKVTCNEIKCSDFQITDFAQSILKSNNELIKTLNP